MRRIRNSAVAIVTACPALLLAVPAFAAGTSGTCNNAGRTNVVTSDADDYTSSKTFVDFTDGKVAFTSANDGCVTVTLSGLSTASGTDFLFERVLLDATIPCEPHTLLGEDGYPVYKGSNTGVAVATSMTFVCRGVPAGKHIIQAQYRSFSGDYVLVQGHTLTVAHR